MKQSTWHNCYDETLKSLITPAAFAHPAKMAKRLCERILEYGEAEGYWQPGSIIVDPFGGIGTTALIGAYRGYPVISIELEPHFVELQRANVQKNSSKLERLGKPLPVVIQGDARRLSALINEAISSIFSPPYADGSAHTGGDDRRPERMTGGTFHGVGLSGSISSPPYAENVKHDYTHEDRDERRLGEGFTGRGRGSFRGSENYGESEGQIGRMSEGEFNQVVGAVTSPPWEDRLSNDRVDPAERVRLARKMGISSAEHISAIDMEKINQRSYGYANDHAAGQIGAESGETYWQAMRQVYAELYAVLNPGGVAAIVVKDFVRDRQRVPLCDRTALLIESIGFTIIERTRAMLVKETHAGIDMFSGEHVTKRVERKSFFRRLAEKNGSPAIDYEEIIWARKM